MAYLSLMANHHDSVSFERIVNRPPRGLGAASVQAILGEWRAMRGSGDGGDLDLGAPAAGGAPGPGTDLLSACRKAAPRLAAKARAGLKELLALLLELGELMEEVSLSELTRTLVTRSGLMEMHRLRDIADSTSRADNLRELVSDMAAYGTGADALTAYLETVSLASAVDREEGAEGARLFLITLHNTKGLEFDRVIITGLEEGIFPHDSSSGAPEDIEEERRLFYVGITRARERLVLTTCRRRRLFGRFTDMSPSRFLAEIPPEALEAEEEGEEEGGRAFQAGGRALRAGGGANDFPAGCGVFHDEYGPGMVERSWYTDGSLVVEVRFTSGRVGRFLPKYSRLERIELST
jgi:DNA helicase-2/ATP-dependent DNA helicase PcrA